MKSADTPFVGGPLDGRVLPVLLGLTGHPPKTYRVPVPDAEGGPATVLVYRRASYGRGGRLGLSQGWRYEFDEGGDSGGTAPDGPGPGPRPPRPVPHRRTPGLTPRRGAAGTAPKGDPAAPMRPPGRRPGRDHLILPVRGRRGRPPRR